MLVLGLACGLVAQGYRPGQTFSSGQQPTPTPISQRPVYRQPVYPRATPVPAQPQQQRRTPASASSMYNMQTRPASTDRETQSSESERASEIREKSTREKREDVSESKSETRSASSSEVESKSASSGKTETVAKSESKADKTPSAPGSTDKLVFFSRPTGKKQVALTYDDGPNPSLTPKLIEWLKANDVPATFFMEGDMVKAYKSLAKDVADAGFELANHTYSHPNLRNLSEEKIVEQLQDTHDIIKEATGIDVKLMRPPYGAHNSKVDEVCERLGYKIINWDVDTNDWRKRSADQIYNTIMDGVSDGSIVLMHDRKHNGRETVLEATKRVVPALRAKGYTFVTVGELIGLEPATEQAQSAPADVVSPGVSIPLVRTDASVSTTTLAPAAPRLPVPAGATPATLLP